MAVEAAQREGAAMLLCLNYPVTLPIRHQTFLKLKPLILVLVVVVGQVVLPVRLRLRLGRVVRLVGVGACLSVHPLQGCRADKRISW